MDQTQCGWVSVSWEAELDIVLVASMGWGTLDSGILLADSRKDFCSSLGILDWRRNDQELSDIVSLKGQTLVTRKKRSVLAFVGICGEDEGWLVLYFRGRGQQTDSRTKSSLWPIFAYSVN